MNAILRLAPELELLAKLEQSQWWAPARIARAQARQLSLVLRHAHETVPFYRTRMAKPDAELRSLPLLTRRDVQDAGTDLHSRKLPATHGRTQVTESSGSTGQPVRVTGSARSQLFWSALSLREHLWHGRDADGVLCSIRLDRSGRAKPPHGAMTRGWGRGIDCLSRNGRMAVLAIGTDVSAQAAWLQRHDPHHLLTFPSNLLALVEHFERHSLGLPRLKEVRTIGETLLPSVRERVRAIWNVPVTDLYSSEELGLIAAQCPSGSGLYHIQSENLLIEVLDDQGRACAPGAVGRVVATTLHNFAMPLLRYETRDYAEAGPPCPCGRGLPTLARILGRKRNMLLLPNGEQRWPLSGFMHYRDIAPIRQFQLAQLDLERIEVRLVSDRPVTPGEEQRLAAVIDRSLGHPFDLSFVYLDAFPPSAGGKFEEFVSLQSQ